MTTNQLDPTRVLDQPQCGNCSAALLPGTVMELNADAFRRVVAVDDVPSLVDFWAPWCSPCRSMESTFNDLATEYACQCRIFKVNIDENTSLSTQYGIRTVPTMILFRDGTDISRRSGVASGENMRTWLNNNL